MTQNHLLIGTRKGLITYKQTNSGKWEYQHTAFLGIPVTIATVDEVTGTWWALLDHGHWGCKVHRSRDGMTWEELEAPKYPDGEEIKDGVPASTKLIWAFSNGGNDWPNTIYLGTEPGGLFKSTNNGDSFELVRGLWDHPSRKEHWFGGGRDHPGLHSILVDPNNSDHIYIGISCAGVFESLDNGTSWHVMNQGLRADYLPDPSSKYGQDPHLIDWCKANPKVMWQQNHCGIFRTTNGGQEWTDVTEPEGIANFGFSIAAHGTDENVAWVVPGVSDVMRVAIDQSICVSRTTDGGKTWEHFRDGLPQDAAFDISYRHALSLNSDNETIAFGTTTGNVYLSENSGETWITLSNNLPMVYSVEFVSTY